ncbi:ABC transporter permease [Naumannella huperziae]
MSTVRGGSRIGGAWAQFAADRGGIVGLVVLLVVIVIAVLTPLLVPLESLDVTRVTARSNEPPSAAHLLGTDPLGRDVLGLLLWGSRISLLVGFAATAVAMVLGTVIGMIAGHARGPAEVILMRVVDFFLVVPDLLLAIVLAAVLPRSPGTIILAIGLTSWARNARLVRAQTLTIEARPYIERARALGAGDGRILGRHVLPAVLPLVLATTTLAVGSAVIAESTLSFLGLGDPNTISWGSMLRSALDSGAATAGYWWFVLPPGLAIVAIVLSFTLVGRALEAVANPSLRGRR